ncbi:Ltp family lipoprotein [Arthrobacter roseus]|uniref:Ltp family lipoprotein n=1 Tax=Arthrobacter roseus TaxID=136274 RepID=UPI0030842CB6|nr:hypothetical protein [Arthrobacter roseus]
MSQTPYTSPYPPANGYGQIQQSNKSFLVTWLLSLLLGILGIDRFYLGKVGTGILKLITLGGLGVWALIDLILVLANKTRDKQGLPLEGYDKNKKVALIVTGVLILLSIVVNSVQAGSSNSVAPAASTPTATPTAQIATATPTPTTDPAVAAAEAKASAKAKSEADAAAKAKADADAAAAKAKADADAAAAKAKAEADAAAQAKAEAEAEAKRGTVSQQNATRKAASYLDFSAFSRSGLISQLEYNKFSTEDATWAVDHVTVDWNAQAAKKAKSYLEFSSFSRSGLVDQLLYNSFTPEQAEYGVAQTGL